MTQQIKHKSEEKQEEHQPQQEPEQQNKSEDNKVNKETNNSSFQLCSGRYDEAFCTLEQIGKGAFGCVKMAYRRSDRKMVI